VCGRGGGGGTVSVHRDERSGTSDLALQPPVGQLAGGVNLPSGCGDTHTAPHLGHENAMRVTRGLTLDTRTTVPGVKREESASSEQSEKRDEGEYNDAQPTKPR
jgi:hypothetical protein